jgi:hypothetical protein
LQSSFNIADPSQRQIVMDQYRNSLFALGALSWVLLVSQPTRRSELQAKEQKDTKGNVLAKPKTQEGGHPQSVIYQVYFMFMLAEWLQVI